MVEFHVLRCAHCQTFQVQQVTKTKKWKCKLCGEKQSILKEYGRGTGADCRRHVQKLNRLRGEMEFAAANTRLESTCQESTVCSTSSSALRRSNHIEQQGKTGWDAFIEKEPRDESDDDDENFESERAGAKVFITTDWSALQNERKQHFKKRKEIYHDRWSKRARNDESLPSTYENPPCSPLPQIYKNCGKDLFRDNNSFSQTTYNQTSSTSSAKSGPNTNRCHSANSFTAATDVKANSFVKTSPSFLCWKSELSLKTELKDCVDNCRRHSKERALHESTIDCLSNYSSSSPVMSTNSYKKEALGSSKGNIFVTTNPDYFDDVANSVPNNANRTPLLSSSEKNHKPSDSSIRASSSKWSTFLNNDEEEEDGDSESDSEHSDFLTHNNVANVNDNESVEEEYISTNYPSIDVKADPGRKSSLFQVGDMDEPWDLDL